MSDLNQANYILEQWAIWVLSNNGFPSTSAIANLGESRGGGKGQPLPCGVEHNSAVSEAIFVFHTMMKTEKGMSDVHILRTFLLKREEREGIKAFCKRHKGFNHNQYSAALNAFSNRLAMYYELHF